MTSPFRGLSPFAHPRFAPGGGGGASPLLTNLAAYWKMDEGSGSALDSLGVLDLTANGSIGTMAGKVGTARTFAAASSQYFSHASTTALQITGDTTLAFWFRCTSTPASQGLIEKENEYKIRVDNNSNLMFLVFDSSSGTSTAADTGTTVLQDVWYFGKAWYTAADKKARVSVNLGTPAVSAALTNGAKASTGNFYTAIDTAVGWSNIALDELGKWNRLFDGTDDSLAYNSGSGTTYPF